MRLSSLHVYPIKSARGISLGSASLDDFGIVHDRRWMVVDAGGGFISQREAHRMALIDVALEGDQLTVSGPGTDRLAIPSSNQDAPRLHVRIWDDTCAAIDSGPEAARWLTHFLGIPARLVHMPADSFRPVNPRLVPAPRRVSFADAYPLLLIGEGSLTDLNSRLEQPLPMNRFRPNLVVSGTSPYSEDQWSEVAIGQVRFDVVKPCDRCVTTTIDQATGEPGKEPLRTLAQYRKWDGQVFFGQNIVHQFPGTIRVGDPVVPHRRA